MKTFDEALLEFFEVYPPGYYGFKFGSDNQFEICLEPLLLDSQFLLALYDHVADTALIEKIVIKPGYQKELPVAQKTLPEDLENIWDDLGILPGSQVPKESGEFRKTLNMTLIPYIVRLQHQAFNLGYQRAKEKYAQRS